MTRQEGFIDAYNRDSDYRQSDNAHEVSDNGQKPPRCANCEIDILWTPVVIRGQTYCCTGCANGGPCCCDYSQYRSVNISGVIHYGPDEEALKKSSD
ncbi:hypothetical protein KDA_25910 [Dictyobacter alpinus]|uniref:Uncharacterized protein n=1 Tax=Dictyobacter alpinus TaxID=2014873 RepID=A0A402B705_9CHLR|nr:hypothetical protein [Dictyobacter alpinus]GCE27107.1 hypothetical protein KDA_25910 [Dictyobacter alpinus]